MLIDTDTVIKSFSDYYGPSIFGDMSDQVGHALAVLVVHVFGGGYPFPDKLARSYGIIERFLERRGRAPLWRWLMVCGLENLSITARDYDVNV